MNVKKKLNLYYWLRKIFVSFWFQSFLINIFFIKITKIRKIVFFLTYKTNHWNKYTLIDKSNLLVSGPGSFPDSEQTKNLIINLKDFIKNNQIKTILDMPCGDFAWMKNLLKANNQILYTGYDIVKNIIDYNNQNFKSDRIKFLQKDIVNEKNFDGFDLVFLRDFFIHLPIKDIITVINVLKCSKIKFFASNSYDKILSNEEIAIGEHRKINLSIDPFNLKEVYCQFPDIRLSDDSQNDCFINIYKIN
jgi:SAM-dependent methyltransferase